MHPSANFKGDETALLRIIDQRLKKNTYSGA